jgi:hypothetical protein
LATVVAALVVAVPATAYGELPLGSSGRYTGYQPEQGPGLATVNLSADGTGTCKGVVGTGTCNQFKTAADAWLGTGPAGYKLEKDGTYFFTVQEPEATQAPADEVPVNSGDKNLSDDHDSWQNRTFDVQGGEIVSYTGTHQFTADEQDGGEKKIRLGPYSSARNDAGVYVVSVCFLGGPGAHISTSGGGYPADKRDCEHDSYKVDDNHDSNDHHDNGWDGDDNHEDGNEVCEDDEPSGHATAATFGGHETDADDCGDDNAPECPSPVFSIESGEKIVRQTFEDQGGLWGLKVIKSENVNFSTKYYFGGSTKPVELTGTAVPGSTSQQVKIFVFDVSGNWRVCDPVMARVSRKVRMYRGLTANEDKLTIRNGRNGFRAVLVRVNGKRFLVRVGQGRTKTISIRSALRQRAKNRVSVRGLGGPGATADVMIAN